MRYRVTHRTEYTYQELVTLCYNEAHLRGRDTDRQQVLSHTTRTEPTAAASSERADFFGNTVLRFTIQSDHIEMNVTAVSEVEVNDAPAAMPASAVSWEDALATLRNDQSPEGLDARQYALMSPMVLPTPEVAAYARESFAPGRPLTEAASDLTRRIHDDFAFEPGFTTVTTPVSQAFEHRRGVCQDFAHLGIACLRALGLPARYVSGYIETTPPPGGAKLVGADASHAWFSVYVPDVGWLDFDPTNNQIAGPQHIVTAWGRDYADVTPVKGVIFGGGGHTTQVSVSVERLG